MKDRKNKKPVSESAIANAQLYFDRTQGEEALRESEENFREVLDR
jgi:hypothetical protein